MDTRVMVLCLMFCMSGLAAMEKQVLAIATGREPRIVVDDGMLSITVGQQRDNQVYRVPIAAANYSRLLAHMANNDKRKISINNVSDEQLCFVVELLIFIIEFQKRYAALPPRNIMVFAIKNYTHNFTLVPFPDALQVIKFFDIPVAFEALTSMRNPIALPTSIDQETVCNLSQRCVDSMVLGSYVRWNRHLQGMMARQKLINIFDCQLVALNNNKTRVAAASIDGVLKIWAFDEAQVRCIYEIHIPLMKDSKVQTVTYSPDENLIALQVSDGSIHIINAYTGVMVNILHGHSCYMGAFSFSPDGRFMASASHDKQVLVREVLTGAVTARLTHHQSAIFSLQWAYDGDVIISASNDGVICFWDVKTQSLLRVHKGCAVGNLARRVGRPAFVLSPDKKRVCLSGFPGNELRVIDSKTGEVLVYLSCFSDNISSLFYSPHGEFIIGFCGNGLFYVWDAHTGELLHTCYVAATFPYVAFSPDGRTIATAYGDSYIQLWDIFSGECIGSPIPVHNFMVNFDFSADGREIIVRLIEEKIIVLGNDFLNLATEQRPISPLSASAMYPISFYKQDSVSSSLRSSITGSSDGSASESSSTSGDESSSSSSRSSIANTEEGSFSKISSISKVDTAS